MERVARNRRTIAVAALLLAGLVATIAVLQARGADSAGRTKVVARTAHNAQLGKTILVNPKGRTLYSLSAERNGTFICTTPYCLSLWKPVVVQPGITPTGVRGLALVTRPSRQRQVAYRGAPLYTFTQDRKPGDIKGNGFKDVGVWRPVTVRSGGQTTSPPPEPKSSFGY
jgi:predicted lipoprotein with Yx(FWY)xxD motif